MGGYYYDGMGYDTYQPTGTGGSGASPPANTVAPAVTGTATVGQTLTTDDGTWTGTATIVFTYQWQRSGVNIGSATNSTYVLVDADYTATVRCVVTGTNGAGNASANSNATAAVVRTYAQQVLADSPLLYWRLGEASGLTAADASGNGRTGTYAGSGVTYSATGAVTGNNAVTTNGSAGYVQSTAAVDLSALSTITIEMWVKFSAYANDFKMLWETAPNLVVSGGIWFCPNDSGGTITLAHFSTSTLTNSYARTDISTGTYHHIVAKYDTSAGISLRVDKVTLTPTATNGTPRPNFANAKMNFAARGDGGTLFLAADIDEIAIYGSGLSTARTDAHYDAKLI